MTVAVELAALTEAFEDATAALNYFVDRETGEVVLVSETLGFIEAGLQRAEMAEHPGRYSLVPVAGDAELTADLDAFIDTLNDEQAIAALDAALDAPNVAMGLTKALAKRELVAAEWTAFRHDQFQKRAKSWLSTIQMEPNRS